MRSSSAGQPAQLPQRRPKFPERLITSLACGSRCPRPAAWPFAGRQPSARGRRRGAIAADSASPASAGRQRPAGDAAAYGQPMAARRNAEQRRQRPVELCAARAARSRPSSSSGRAKAQAWDSALQSGWPASAEPLAEPQRLHCQHQHRDAAGPSSSSCPRPNLSADPSFRPQPATWRSAALAATTVHRDVERWPVWRQPACGSFQSTDCGSNASAMPAAEAPGR